MEATDDGERSRRSRIGRRRVLVLLLMWFVVFFLLVDTSLNEKYFQISNVVYHHTTINQK